MLVFNIKNIRTRKGISLRQLSKATDISKSYLSFLENNKRLNPTIEVMVKIASALDCNVKELFYTRLDIEDVRNKMHECIDEFGLDSEKVLEYSQLLDLILNINKELD